MPILYVHGVGVRAKGDTGWNAAQPFLGGLGWNDIEGHLRRSIAPVLSPAPQAVHIEQVFWGDLGAAPLLPAQAAEPALDPNKLSPAALASALEERGRQLMPIQSWPQVIEVSAAVARDLGLRPRWTAQPTPEARWEKLLHLAEDELHRRYPLGSWPLMAFFRQDLRRQLLSRMSHIRGPLEGFLPYFMGDVMGYPLRRGAPSQPGPIPQRVLAGLRQMQAIKAQTGESIVVLTHSMGGQLMYDALSAYAPAQHDLRGLKVDFWAATASQLGLFASLNLFVQPTNDQGVLPPLHNLGYLWNVWSPADFLSFQGGGVVPEAQDIAMTLTEDLFKAHMAYLATPLFYQVLASKLKVQLTLS